MDHFEAQVLDSGPINPGKSFKHKFDETGQISYSGVSDIHGNINVIDVIEDGGNNTVAEYPTKSLNLSEIKWQNFTNDQKLFSVQIPLNWKAKVGNRFIDGPRLILENTNGNPNLVDSKISINIFSNLSPAQWNELKTNIPTNLNNTKIVEPINCKKYVIDTVKACSLLYAGDDKDGKREAVLAIAFMIESTWYI